MKPSALTPVGIPLPAEPRRPGLIGAAGFGMLLLSAVGSAIKDVGVVGVGKQIVDIASRSWYVGGSLVAFAGCWFVWLLLQGQREQAESFRAFATEVIQEIRDEVRVLREELRSAKDELPDAVGAAVADHLSRIPTTPTARR